VQRQNCRVADGREERRLRPIALRLLRIIAGMEKTIDGDESAGGQNKRTQRCRRRYLQLRRMEKAGIKLGNIDFRPGRGSKIVLRSRR
jgi:hypothetical protein